ncbi:MAG: UDP-N-acetylmuramoyl-L-alanine--D-glutamate ligase [Candidatus Marinimicrobia bacterium]|nr:UDP-N-acetylmuramoyl-L-alanine--D-glutamate ligase [Candidatus Neomarinimicrobiota bacterium]
MIDLSTSPINISGKKIGVLGAGRSGMAIAQLLAQNGADVLLSDARQITFTAPQRQKFQSLNIKTEFGEHSASILQSDLIVISPGIPATTPIVQQIEAAEIPIVSEIEAAYWFMPDARLIAVTGSNGKTTTTTLIYEMFKDSQYDAYCGGNIGTPFSSLIPQVLNDAEKPKVFILELSSFQLERIIHFHPDVAIILNVTDDHMDRYDHDINLYLKAKLNISKNQTAKDLFVYFSDDKLLSSKLPNNPQKRPFGLEDHPDMQFKTDMVSILTKDGQEYIDRKNIKLLGEHNLLNILATLNVTKHFNISKDRVIEALKHFSGIEHRLEYVRTVSGVDYYNDSKATNVESVKYALKSFDKPVIIILGGRDKDADFSILLPYLKKHVKHVLLIGEAASKIASVIHNIVDYSYSDSMESAVNRANHIAQDGDIVLLAPACASFDMFDNYEHRGRVFKEIVASISEDRK